MPFYDRICTKCEAKMIDSWEPIETPTVLCANCGEPTERAWFQLGKTPNVISDDIPGGIEIRHGLCNEDGSPRTYYSKTEIRKEAERRGLVQRVEHTTERGTDKNKHTVKWY
jgi:hypothetical protein